MILSVKLKPLCIGPIMSAKADKGDRKREIEQSPMKKMKNNEEQCSVRPMFSVMCGLSCFLFMVVSCSYFYVIFIFYNRHLYFYLFYLISKGIFHLGGLVSKMHISVYVLFTEWKCFCFFFHLLSTILGL